MDARLWILGGALVAWLLALRWVRRHLWLYALLVLPGTLAHELCHLVTGLVLNARPASFRIHPHRHGDGWALGAVGFRNLRWYNRFFVGLAPLALLGAAWTAVAWRLLPETPRLGWREALLAWAWLNLVPAALPSRQDLRIAARTPVGWVLLAAALVWAFLRLRGAT